MEYLIGVLLGMVVSGGAALVVCQGGVDSSPEPRTKM